MRLRSLGVLLGLLLGACDGPTTVISHVSQRGGFGATGLWTLQDARGIPVEVHGSPFTAVTDIEVAGALRPPAGTSQDVTFYARPPGGGVEGSGWRLVLHFNAQGAPNAPADCARITEARTNLPTPGAFTVNAVFCDGREWRGQGFMRVRDIEDGDMAAFTNVMAQLMQVMLREERDDK